MFSTHLLLIGTNQTTVERLAGHDMKGRKSAMLDEMYSFCAFRFVPLFSTTPRGFVLRIGWVFSGQSGKRDEVGMQSIVV